MAGEDADGGSGLGGREGKGEKGQQRWGREERERHGEGRGEVWILRDIDATDVAVFYFVGALPTPTPPLRHS